MNKIIIVTLFYLFILTNNLNCQNPGNLTSDQKTWLSKASRSEKNGWISVHLEGSPEALGFQHGYLLASEIIDLCEAIKMYYTKATAKSWDFYRERSTSLFWQQIPSEYQKELDGIVSGANSKLGKGKIDRKDIIAMNSILEMTGYYVPWLKSKQNPKVSKPTPAGHCSAIAATGSWTKDGRIVMAHNNWTCYVVGERWNIIMDIVPEKGNRIIMDAPPGFIHSGDDFNINSAGLIVTETTITQFHGFDTSGVAEFVRARRAIQYASTIDEWASIMKEKSNGGYANDWLIGDNKTGEIARLELGLKNQILEKTKDGCLIGSNFPSNEKLIREETSFDVTLPNSSPNARKTRWEELMKEYKGKIDVNAAMKFMGDHSDVISKKNKASGLTLCGHFDDDATAAWYWDQQPYDASGAVQGKATDGTLAGAMKLWARMGHPCGESFVASDFLARHPEFSYQKGLLHDMPSQPWTLFGKMDR